MDWTSAGTAVGGVLVGVGSVVAYVIKKDRRVGEPDRREPDRVIPLNGTKCNDHTKMCEAVAVLPMLHETVTAMRNEMRTFAGRVEARMDKDAARIEKTSDELYQIVRRHERSIGRLEGMADATDDDTKGHERIRA